MGERLNPTWAQQWGEAGAEPHGRRSLELRWGEKGHGFVARRGCGPGSPHIKQPWELEDSSMGEMRIGSP